MKFLLLLLAIVFMALGLHYRPWVTYTGKLYAFFVVFAMVAIFLKSKIALPKMMLPLVLLSFIPFVQ